MCPRFETQCVGALPVDAELVVIDSSMSRIGPEDDVGARRPVTPLNVQST